MTMTIDNYQNDLDLEPNSLDLSYSMMKIGTMRFGISIIVVVAYLAFSYNKLRYICR